MRKTRIGFLCAFIVIAGVLLHEATLCAEDTAAEARPAEVLNLDKLISEALLANPGILASQKNRDALW